MGVKSKTNLLFRNVKSVLTSPLCMEDLKDVGVIVKIIKDCTCYISLFYWNLKVETSFRENGCLKSHLSFLLRIASQMPESESKKVLNWNCILLSIFLQNTVLVAELKNPTWFWLAVSIVK